MSASPSRATGARLGSVPPKSWTIVAWAAVAATSVILTYLITLALGLALTGFGFLVALATISRISFIGILLAAFALIVGVTVLWSLVPRKVSLDLAGTPIDLSREVRLREELEAIAHAMGERMPKEVYLIPAANAAVMQFRGERLMLLGLPLLQLLTVSQFRAVMAHEFAHYYAGDTRLGPWVFKARDSMTRVLVNLTRESEVLSLLRRWAVIAILHMAIIGGLVLYWKLLARITQYISRRQEFRCDELACYVAGSASLEGGLRNVSRAAAGFGAYWSRVVATATASGIRPQVADGFARFMAAPAIAQAVEAEMEKRLASDVTGVHDSHPPLSARLRRIRRVGILATNEDERPAVALLDDLPGLELGLLQKLAPKVNVAGMKTVGWDSVGSEVYVPMWRKQTERLQQLLGPCAVVALPEKLRALPEIANRIPDVPGNLPTREQRLARVTESLGLVLTLALVDYGWRLHFQPGQFYLERDSERLEPGLVMGELRSGKMTAEDWEEYCRKRGMGEWALVGGSPTVDQQT
jgi:heat shock protein HtpX